MWKGTKLFTYTPLLVVGFTLFLKRHSAALVLLLSLFKAPFEATFGILKKIVSIESPNLRASTFSLKHFLFSLKFLYYGMFFRQQEKPFPVIHAHRGNWTGQGVLYIGRVLFRKVCTSDNNTFLGQRSYLHALFHQASRTNLY